VGGKGRDGVIGRRLAQGEGRGKRKEEREKRKEKREKRKERREKREENGEKRKEKSCRWGRLSLMVVLGSDSTHVTLLFSLFTFHFSLPPSRQGPCKLSIGGGTPAPVRAFW